MKNRVGRPLLPAGAVVLLLLTMGLLLAGCGFDFSLSCGDTESETKTYADADYGYSFQYPGDWEVQPGDSAEVTGGSGSEGGMSVYDPDGAVAGSYYVDLFQVSVYELNVIVVESMMSEIKAQVEGLLADLEAQGSDWRQVEGLSEATVGGMSGYRATYDFTLDGTPATSTFYFVFTSDIQYQLTLQAVTENWKEKQPEFDAIVASFKPGTDR